MDFLKARTSADAITERLRDEIVNGTLRPGQQLLQESLSERYGVSRSPLREALRHLEAEGLVIYEANRGATVASYSTDDIMEIFEIRRLLESSAIRQAATAMDAGPAARPPASARADAPCPRRYPRTARGFECQIVSIAVETVPHMNRQLTFPRITRSKAGK